MAQLKLHTIGLSGAYESEQLRNLDSAAYRLSFLSEVSRRMSFALTDQECFQQLLCLLVPEFADWGTITIMNERGEIWRAVAAHADPDKALAMTMVGNKYPSRLDDAVGSGAVIRNRKSEFYPEFESRLEDYVKKIRYPELADLVRSLGIRSEICVPLEAHGRVLGAILLATSESGRRFDVEDLRMAEEVASRAALAAYHAIRYEMASRVLERLRVERELREDYFSQVRHDILSILTSATLLAQMIAKKESDADACGNLARKVVLAIEKVSDILQQTKTSRAEPK